MIDEERIEERLRKLGEYSGYLEYYRGNDYDKFVKDYTLRGAAERYFQLSAECVVYVCEILISNLKLRKPESAREAIEIISENKIIPDEFCEKIKPLAGFRNILVHDYLKIDYKKMYDYLQNNIDDFNAFAKYVAGFIAKK